MSFICQAEDGKRAAKGSRGLGDGYKRQAAAAYGAAASTGTGIPERQSKAAHVNTRKAPARPSFVRPTLTECGVRRGDPWMSEKHKTLLPPHPHLYCMQRSVLLRIAALHRKRIATFPEPAY